MSRSRPWSEEQPPDLDGSPEAPATIAELMTACGLSELPNRPSADELEARLRRLGVSLGGADKLRRETARQEAIRILTTLDLKAPAKIVDAALPDPKRKNESRGGRTVSFEAPVPWPDPVNGSQLLDDLSAWLNGYVHMDESAARTIALWAVSTWFVEVVYFAPPLVLLSATKRSGKTLILDLLRTIVRRGYSTSGTGVTSAVLFRLNDQHRPTFLIDEAEKLGGADANRDLVGLLNSGYRKGAMVARCSEPNHEVVQFDAFGFRALAAIGSLWDTIEDRAIIIPCARKPRAADIRRFSSIEVEEEGAELSRLVARWASDHEEAVRAGEQTGPRPKWLNDRACDSWSPLFAVAGTAGGKWPTFALDAARELARSSDEGRGERLIHDLRDVFASRGNPEAISSGEVVKALNDIETGPWGDLRRGSGLSAHALAKRLKPFDVRPQQRRTSEKEKVRGYWLEDFRMVFERYPPPSNTAGEPGQWDKTNADKECRDSESGTTSPSPSHFQSPETVGQASSVPLSHLKGGMPDEGVPDLFSAGNGSE